MLVFGSRKCLKSGVAFYRAAAAVALRFRVEVELVVGMKRLVE